MYLLIFNTLDGCGIELTSHPRAFMNDVRLQYPGATVRFCRKYKKECRYKLAAFIASMTPAQVNWYAKQDPYELVLWFNRVAGCLRPLRSEAEVIRSDTERTLAKLNIWR